MAVPKRRKSRARTHHRRSAWKTAPTTTVTCPCAKKIQIRPHRACHECGLYRDRQVRES